MAQLRLARVALPAAIDLRSVLSVLWPDAGKLLIMVNDSLTRVLALEASCLA